MRNAELIVDLAGSQRLRRRVEHRIGLDELHAAADRMVAVANSQSPRDAIALRIEFPQLRPRVLLPFERRTQAAGALLVLNAVTNTRRLAGSINDVV